MPVPTQRGAARLATPAVALAAGSRRRGRLARETREQPLEHGRKLHRARVLLVELLDFFVGHLHVLGDLLEDPLGEKARADVRPHLRVGEPLLRELRLVLLLVTLEELLLQLLQALLDVCVGDLDLELLRRDLELGLLDQAADDRVAELCEVGRSRRRKLLVAGLVRLLGLRDEPVVLRLRDLPVADDRDGPVRNVGRLAVVTAAAGGSGSERERSDEGDDANPKRHMGVRLGRKP